MLSWLSLLFEAYYGCTPAPGVRFGLPVAGDEGISIQQRMHGTSYIAYPFAVDKLYLHDAFVLTLGQIIRDKRFQVFWCKVVQIKYAVYF